MNPLSLKAPAGPNVIAIDGDGVLVDYVQAYRDAWFKWSGELLSGVAPNAYWATERWGARQLEGQELQDFRTYFDSEFWRSIPAMAGAIEACQLLRDAGYTLVCVSAIDEEHAVDRLFNLIAHKMDIKTVVSTGNDWKGQLEVSPKASAINSMMPAAFVDDFAPYLRGLSEDVHKALIESGMHGTPNVGHDLTLADSVHPSLLDFAKAWLQKNPKAPEAATEFVD